MILLFVIAIILTFWLWFPLASTTFSLLKRPTSTAHIKGKDEENSDFACLITVYKNLEIAIPLVQSILSQSYAHYHIYLVADRVNDTSFPIQDDQLTVFFPDQALNSKVKSIAYALDRLVRKHSHVLIFDPDNLVHREALNFLDQQHRNGFRAVQGKRIAKNIDSTYAALDALGEHYYDYFARKMPFILGSSSTIAGSGMSIAYSLYARNIKRELINLEKDGIVVSEDKALQLELVNDGHRIAYEEKAIIFDEKVEHADQVSRQRTRWLNSYFRHLKDVFPVFIKGLFSADINKIYFALNTMMPPLIILFGGTLFMIFVLIWLSPLWAMILFISLIAFGLNFLISLRLNHTPGQVWHSIPQIPLFAINQILALLKIRKANTDFMQTSHIHQLTIEEVWSKRKKDFKHLFDDD